jgi:hypothetical protein
MVTRSVSQRTTIEHRNADSSLFLIEAVLNGGGLNKKEISAILASAYDRANI